MTQAISAIGPSIREQSVEPTIPLVFVNGSPDPDLSVVSASFSAPMDEREVTIHLANRALISSSAHYDAEVVVAVPHALSDGELRWQVLLSGRLVESEAEQSSGKDQSERVVRDRLALLLAEPISLLGPWLTDALTLEVVLNRLGARLDAELVFACEADVLMAPVSSASPETDTIGQRLRPVLSDLGLSLEQTLAFDRQKVRRTLTVLPERTGRRVSLPWPDSQGRGGSVVSVVVDREARPPRVWVAQGDRPVVEDTFVLQRGWDPALQGQPDGDYGRLTSSDFSRFGAVYRDWVLNEDGSYSDAPFDLGARFDVGSLFDQPGTVDEPLRLGACLTLGPAGRRLAPIVESSTDAGLTWSAYPGQVEVMADRAGVQFMDDELPSGILAAAKAGTLRVRVTASLTSPRPIEERRWDGNPFAGPAPTRVIDPGGSFRWRLIGASSIHRQAISDGTLQADTSDDRPALRARLQAHITRQPGPKALVKLDLAGAWTSLRLGDRVRDALGKGIAIDGTPASFATRDARIIRIDFSFGVLNASPRTRLRLD